MQNDTPEWLVKKTDAQLKYEIRQTRTRMNRARGPMAAQKADRALQVLNAGGRSPGTVEQVMIRPGTTSMLSPSGHPCEHPFVEVLSMELMELVDGRYEVSQVERSQRGECTECGRKVEVTR